MTKAGAHTDGNGIIIDDFQHKQSSGYPSYKYPTLVENNLVYQNGGKGIQVTWSDHVTVRDNTAWHNNLDQANSGTWRGEISNSQSSDNVLVNNIAVADPSVNPANTAIDSTSYGGYVNKVTWANNLTFNGTSGDNSVRTTSSNDKPSASGNMLGVTAFRQQAVQFRAQGQLLRPRQRRQGPGVLRSPRERAARPTPVLRRARKIP